MLILKTGSSTEKTTFCDPAAKWTLLCEEHDDLDCAIAALLRTGAGDDLLIRRLKKRKLQLKDEIAQILPPLQRQSAVG